MTKEEWVNCILCGELTDYKTTKLCTNCWEVEHRIDYFLTKGGQKAIDYLRAAIIRYKASDQRIGEGS